jgi:hypothetical protein
VSLTPDRVLYRGGLHYRYASKAWLGLFATLPDGRQLMRHELTFVRKSPEAAADEITAFVKAENLDLAYIAANPDLWPQPQQPGETVSESFITAGVPLVRGSADRVNGWIRVRSMLAVRVWPQPSGPPVSGPALIIHPDCKYFLRTFSTIVAKADAEDEPEDSPALYPALGLMYFAMSRPLPRPGVDVPLPKGAIGHLLRQYQDGTVEV